IDTALFGQFTQAAASLQNALTACQANPGSATYCASLNAQRSAAAALIAQADAFASNLSHVYGGNGRAPSLIVPTGFSSALATIDRRLRAFGTQYSHFDSLTGGPGIAPQGPV